MQYGDKNSSLLSVKIFVLLLRRNQETRLISNRIWEGEGEPHEDRHPRLLINIDLLLG